MSDPTSPKATTPVLRESATFDRLTIQEIQRAAETGIYDIRGGGTKRKLPHFDDLLLLGASVSRYPLEGYREKCGTDVILGNRFAKKPIHLKIPVTIQAVLPVFRMGASAAWAMGTKAPSASKARRNILGRRLTIIEAPALNGKRSGSKRSGNASGLAGLLEMKGAPPMDPSTKCK
jgi:hypothetical protein